MPEHENIDFKATVTVVENKDSKVNILRNDTGEGFMTFYKVLDDIYLLYNDFHMIGILNEMNRDIDCFAMDYCYEGRLECALPNGVFSYQKPGDLSMDSRKKVIDEVYFPLGHYHSLSLVFYFPKSQESLEEKFSGFPVNLSKLRDKFLEHSYPCFIQNNQEISRIFEDLRNIKSNNGNTYAVLKILELLLVLDNIETPELMKYDDYSYFHKSDVEKVKLIQRMMSDNLERNYTLNELAEISNMSLTSMTSCFKGVYGKPINTFMREYKMSHAAKELITSDISIADIGLNVGYSNPSKFSRAFKQVIGVLPKEYRKKYGGKKNGKR